MTALEREILKAVRASTWRGEPSLCRQFDKDWRKHTPRSYSRIVNGRWQDVFEAARSPMVEDALFNLVRADKIEWFGGGDQGFEPLKYRIPRRRRK